MKLTSYWVFLSFIVTLAAHAQTKKVDPLAQYMEVNQKPTLKTAKVKGLNEKTLEDIHLIAKQGKCNALNQLSNTYRDCYDFTLYIISKNALENTCDKVKVQSQKNACLLRREKAYQEFQAQPRKILTSLDAPALTTSEKIEKFENKVIDECIARAEIQLKDDQEALDKSSYSCVDDASKRAKQIAYQKKCHTCVKDKESMTKCLRLDLYEDDLYYNRLVNGHAFTDTCSDLKQFTQYDTAFKDCETYQIKILTFETDKGHCEEINEDLKDACKAYITSSGIFTDLRNGIYKFLGISIDGKVEKSQSVIKQ